MRILYVTAVNPSRRGGDAHHVVGLCGALAQRGLGVTLVCGGQNFRLPGLEVRNLPRRPGESFLLYGRRLAREAMAAAAKARPDWAYVRPFRFAGLWLRPRLQSAGVPYVCEINSKSDEEDRLRGFGWKVGVYRHFEGRLLEGARGWLAVTDELGTWARNLSGAPRPMGLALNGFDEEEASSRGARKVARRKLGLSPEKPAAVMAGFGRPWHGVDRALEALALWKEGELWLVGSANPSGDPVMDMARAKGCADRVRLFPWLEGRDLGDILSAADAALGSLALDRNDMREAQPMKIRSCLALGLPVIFSYHDPAVPENLPFVRRVRGVQPGEVAVALKKLTACPAGLRLQARRFARKNLSWQASALLTETFLQSLGSGSLNR